MRKLFNIFLFAMFYLVCCVQNGKAQNEEKDTIYKFGDFLIHVRDTMKIDFLLKGKPHAPIHRGKDTLYEDSKIIILGNSDKLYLPYAILKKYNAPYKFSKFAVPVYKHKLAAPNFKTDPSAWLFRTQIRDQCKSKGINFAGHYTIAHWGCGSECEGLAVVDRINGKIYYSNIVPLSKSAFFDFKTKADSKMIVMNYWLLADYKGYIVCSVTWKIIIATWHNSKFKFLPTD